MECKGEKTGMIRESVVENTIISLLQDQGYELFDTNDNWFSSRRLDEFINKELFLSCLERINKYGDNILYEDVYNKITRLENPSLFERNFAFHRILVDGITIESKKFRVNPLIKLIDFENPQNNVFQVEHQMKFQEGRSVRIPDVVVYVNGLPLVVMELKSFDEDATAASLDDAYT